MRHYLIKGLLKRHFSSPFSFFFNSLKRLRLCSQGLLILDKISYLRFSYLRIFGGFWRFSVVKVGFLISKIKGFKIAVSMCLKSFQKKALNLISQIIFLRHFADYLKAYGVKL